MAIKNKTEEVITKELNEIAEELKLTDRQKLFCDSYFFITNRDAIAAFELAGYSISTKRESFKTEELYQKYLLLEKTRRSTELMNNPKIRKYITAIHKAREEYVIVDKFWVINKLKHLADNAPESVQFNATKLLGQHLDMFNTSNLNIHNDLERPDVAMKKIWAMRKAREEEKKSAEE